MDPFTIAAGAAGAGANLIGTFMGNEWNREAATTNRRWQEEMSGSAHQREVSDLKKAGLNPILSANAGASTGSGGGATGLQAPQIDMPAIWSQMNQKTALAQADTKLQQDQQRINIDKANSAAGIAKSLSGAELDKANTIAAKTGWMSKWLGTTGAQKAHQNMMNGIRPIDPLHLKEIMGIKAPADRSTNKQPPSSGGSLP